MANTKALQDAIKLICDVIIDSAEVSQGKVTAQSALSGFSNIFGDLMVLLPEISQLSLSNLTPSDYEGLVASLSADLVFPKNEAKLQAIITTSLKLLGDMSAVIIPDLLAIVNVFKQ